MLEVVVSGAQATVDCWPSWLQTTPAPGRGPGARDQGPAGARDQGPVDHYDPCWETIGVLNINFFFSYLTYFRLFLRAFRPCRSIFLLSVR